VIPAEGVTMVFGASTSGKTFVVLDMAFAIALGQDWRGRKVNQGRVVYVAAEGAAGFRKRLHAYAEHYQINLEDVDLHVVSAAPSLLEREQMAKLADYVNSIGGCAHTVFDTVAQVTAGGNENSGEDMGKALKNCQDYNRAVGCSSSLIHHTGKDETRGARGWSGIRAAVDAELEVTRNDEARAMKVTKLKDGEEGADFGFKLAVIPLGIDEDGEVIDSCVVEHNDASFNSVKRAKNLGPNEKALRQAIADLAIGSDGFVDLEEAVDGALAYLPAPKEGHRDRRPENLKRSAKTLERDGMVEIYGGQVRLAAKDEE